MAYNAWNLSYDDISYTCISFYVLSDMKNLITFFKISNTGMPLWKWNLLVTSIRKSNQLISRDCQFRGSHWKSLKVTFTVLFHFIFNLYHNKPTLYGYFVIKDISFFERLIRWYFDCKLYQCCGPVGCECSPGRSSSLICFQAGKVWRKKNLLSCFFLHKN